MTELQQQKKDLYHAKIQLHIDFDLFDMLTFLIFDSYLEIKHKSCILRRSIQHKSQDNFPSLDSFIFLLPPN